MVQNVAELVLTGLSLTSFVQCPTTGTIFVKQVSTVDFAEVALGCDGRDANNQCHPDPKDLNNGPQIR